ncbi:hypothetical protein OEZ86_009587 [Tetradesmus obliquus]|uniref:Septin-type G domain-containing protein n=1 Tax=Tetradesmus obliquus TaxID=3088 RepID=A0ABY8UMI9_TETOB|nr:hypothetical protein OEZ85_001032 [Tetradesmus obliquus]WIA43058.1 hypothetical protein OEZ86_009587 [Tetradesmus obliquus]
MVSLAYPTYVNIMLYGESGLGKTTCIRNLIGSWLVQRCGSGFSAATAGAKTSLSAFRADPDSLRIQLAPIRDATSNLEMHFSFQDMPGWGDDINLVNSLKTVVHFLLKQRQRDYRENRAGQTEHCAVPGTMMRHGITVCLYFVPPHRAKPIDWIMMAAISKLVAVIPVIAKADTFTDQELADFRQELLQVIHHGSSSSSSSPPRKSSPGAVDGGKQQPPEAVGLARELCLETYSFRERDLAMVGADGSRLPPFAIVASQELLTAQQVGQPGLEGGEVGQPFRQYRWGTAFPLHRGHSDLVILKQLLCGHRNLAVHDLLQDSWRRAFTFRHQYEALLRRAGRCDGIGLAPGQSLGGVSLQPLVDEVCCSTCGGTSELQDKLRSEEAKRTLTDLSRAREALARSAAVEQELHQQVKTAGREADSLRGQLQAASGVIEHLRAELEEARASRQQKGKLAAWLAKDKQQQQQQSQQQRSR